ncbi:MAG: hypothetical protein IJE58_00145 [Oscillospiraceae bacterium]|nr:hypothetical protein [Oscillospiraceae bacterium]
MTSYYQTKKTMQLMGGHICSKCKSMIFTNFIFFGMANSRWSQKKAQEGAEAAAEKGMKALLSFPEKPFLVTQISEERTYGLVSGFGVENLNHGCPYCGNREKWQKDVFAFTCQKDPVSGVSLVEDVPEESRLTVLLSKDALDAWQMKSMIANTVNFKKYWEAHPTEAECVRGQIQALKNQIEALNAEKLTVREKSQWLCEKVGSKEAEMKSFSLFSAERKAAKAELNELKEKYNAQSTADIEREKSIIRTISGLEDQIQELKISNPGVLGEMEKVTPKDAPYCQAIRSC